MARPSETLLLLPLRSMPWVSSHLPLSRRSQILLQMVARRPTVPQQRLNALIVLSSIQPAGQIARSVVCPWQGDGDVDEPVTYETTHRQRYEPGLGEGQQELEEEEEE